MSFNVPIDRFAYERMVWRQAQCIQVAGVDEAGRGPLAGPVVAAAVILPEAWDRRGLPSCFEGLNDSKQLTERQRENFFLGLTTHPEIRFGVAQVDAAMIDCINILQATHRAMNEALGQLRPAPKYALVDGLPVASLQYPHLAIIKGDARSYSIAAASVVAKVTRDRLMVASSEEYPHYGFAEHKGYGTARHLAAIARHGPCPLHRRSFSPLQPAEMDLFAMAETSHGPVGSD